MRKQTKVMSDKPISIKYICLKEDVYELYTLHNSHLSALKNNLFIKFKVILAAC